MLRRNYDKLAIAAEQNVKEREFWLNTLSGELHKTGFPYDRSGEKARDMNLEKIGFSFSGEIYQQLMKLSKGSAVKLHMILAAALTVLLARYTGDRDIIIGTPIYKQEVEIEFINTVLVLRNRIRESLTFKELLLQVRETLVQAANHQNYPLEVLLEQLGLAGESQNLRLFDVVILLEKIHARKYLQWIRYHILFSFDPDAETQQIRGEVEYRSGLYEAATIRQILAHYRELVQQAAGNVELSLSGIQLLAEPEKRQLLEEFNGTRLEDTPRQTLPELFTQQVEQTPDRTALVSEERLQDLQITYRELDRKAGQLADFLRKKGIAADTVAALMVERSLEMMVGILGIMKAGGAYLPIDLAYPPERIRYMLTESNAKILFTYKETQAALAAAGNRELPLEIIDIFSPALYTTEPSGVNRAPRWQDAAYIIYTSGSTGKPKGVLVEQGNAASYLHAFYHEFEITHRDIALQQASYSFDAFVEEVYPVIFRGGKIALCPRYVVMDTLALSHFIHKHDITVISVSPLLLNEIAQLPGIGSIRILISGGDELKQEYIANLLPLKNRQIYNTYGPTEATVCATYYRCSAKDENDPPIGKPITNYRIYILDPLLRLVPLGVPGELCIAGPGITRGYLNNPELTNKKFCLRRPGNLFEKRFPGPSKNFLLDPSPLTKKPARRAPSLILTTNTNTNTLYKTGDRARWLSGGSIEFLGRLDNQVKIRGFRIETGEIETCLLTHPAVEAALVLARETPTSGKERQLCAYIATHEELTVPVLREFLTAQLPDYMVPAYFVFLERIPLTPHGKPDLKALAAYELISGTGVEYIAPATAAEKALAGIWQDLLQCDRIGINDNFFDLGGNSLLLLKATHRIREVFGTQQEIPFMVMFQYTTVASLAGHLDRAAAGESDTGQKYHRQSETLNRGKDRVKKFLQRTREAENG
jgi:amino acid adenylation domain-containing protein